MPDNNTLVQGLGSRYDCILEYFSGIPHATTRHENEICQCCKEINPHSLESLLHTTRRPVGATDLEICQRAVRTNSEAHNSEAQTNPTTTCASRTSWFLDVKFGEAQKSLSEELIKAKPYTNMMSTDPDATRYFEYTPCDPLYRGRPGEICNRCALAKAAWMARLNDREMNTIFEQPVGRILTEDARTRAGG